MSFCSCFVKQVSCCYALHYNWNIIFLETLLLVTIVCAEIQAARGKRCLGERSYADDGDEEDWKTLPLYLVHLKQAAGKKKDVNSFPNEKIHEMKQTRVFFV